MSVIYENAELLKVESKSVIPDFVMSFSEAALYVAESMTVDYNNLMESIGVEELAVYESTGMEIVYEGEKLNSFKDKIVEFFQNIWKSIKGFFEKILNWFETKRKESVKNMGSKINAADLSKLPDDAVFGKMHKYGAFIVEAEKFAKNTDSFLKEVDNEFEKICKGVDETDAESKKKAVEDGNTLKDELSKKIFKEVSGYDVDSMDAVKKAIEEKLVGEEFEINKGNISTYLPGLLAVTTGGKVNDAIKSLYKSNKKLIDDAISRAKKYEGSRALCAAKELYVYREVFTCSNSVIGKVMDIYKRWFTESRNVLVKVYNKAGKIKDVKESAVVEESVLDKQINLVESILNY